jgi:3-methylcrotonyl-CoA carboxylase alpha subunit
MFDSVLIANRGEIALRIIRTARRLGLRTIAVYSTADANAAHVELADEAWAIGAAPAAQSYLNIDRVVGAAKASGAQAIHPGYGFLSENPRFAAACQQAGLVFVGPPVAAMEQVGAKSAAKDVAAALAIPLIPGYAGQAQDLATLTREANTIGYPLIIKASAGGGGKGMRVVRGVAEFRDALTGAQREAQAAFGDPTVLLEKFIERARHVEVQVFLDAQGNAVHLYERDCSLQRRHQKVIEEAPAPNLSASLRSTLFEQALALARAVGYVGAGTVEFLCKGESHWFIEMNARLQVEHPVTEMVTGLDLVEWQLRIAAGEALPLGQEQIHCAGHAIEVRLCAEDPRRDLLPAIGTLRHYDWPELATDRLRVDTALRAGEQVTPFYDSLIAKLIVKAASRNSAIQAMQQALAATRLGGIATNREFLQVLCATEEFRAANFDTQWLSRHGGDLAQRTLERLESVPEAVLALLTRWACCDDGAEGGSASIPWQRRDLWWLNLAQQRQLRFRANGAAIERLDVDVTLEANGNCVVAAQGGAPQTIEHWNCDAGVVSAAVNGQRLTGRIWREGAVLHWQGAAGTFQLRLWEASAAAAQAGAGTGPIAAPMPGQIVAVRVAVGQAVRAGEVLLILEAMKMEHSLTAAADGIVSVVKVKAGDRVLEGQLLLRVEA